MSQSHPWALFAALLLMAGSAPLRADPIALADFNSDPATNVGGEITVRQKIPSSVKWALDDEVFHGAEGKSLRVDYTRLRGGEECYLVLRIPGVDLRAYDRLTFWVKGAEGGELFEGALRSAAGDQADKLPETVVPIEKPLPGGVTTEWQQVSIPLSALLAGRQGALNSGSLLLVFNRITKFSTVYIDDILLETADTGSAAGKPAHPNSGIDQNSPAR